MSFRKVLTLQLNYGVNKNNMKELIEIQSRLIAAKTQYNEFGKFPYRKAEDILAAVKPLLKEQNCILLLSDEVKEIGSAFTLNQQDTKKGTASTFAGTRVYIEVTATIINAEGQQVSVKASAREEVVKSGMDAAQITGATSSYARKYALCGLFAIDNEKDPDATINGQPSGYQQPAKQQAQTTGNETIDEWLHVYAFPQIAQAQTKADLNKIYNDWPQLQDVAEFKTALTARRKALGIKNSNEQ